MRRVNRTDRDVATRRDLQEAVIQRHVSEKAFYDEEKRTKFISERYRVQTAFKTNLNRCWLSQFHKSSEILRARRAAVRPRRTRIP